jgi:hypothetical protein
MPKGKIHGQGGKKGHNTNEARARFARQEAAQLRIKRAQASRARRADRKTTELANKINTELEPLAEKAFEMLGEAFERKKVTRAQYLFCALAINRWLLEEIAKNFNQNKMSVERALPEDFRIFNFLEDKAIYSALKELRITYPRKQLIENIEKWRTRVPKIVQGHYV